MPELGAAVCITGAAATRSRTRPEWWAGARAMLPWLVGVIPFGLVIGATISESSVSPLAGLAMGVTIYGGSAQLATVELLDRGVAPVTIILTVLIINARLIAYSGSIAVYWRGTSRRFRALAAYLLVDPSFAVGMDRYADPDAERPGHHHYLGGAVLLFVAWQVAIVVGLSAGAGLPAWLHLEFVVPLFLVAQVVRHGNRSRGAGAAAVVGGAVAVAGMDLPISSGLVVAIVAGIAAAIATDRLPRARGTRR